MGPAFPSPTPLMGKASTITLNRIGNSVSRTTKDRKLFVPTPTMHHLRLAKAESTRSRISLARKTPLEPMQRFFTKEVSANSLGYSNCKPLLILNGFQHDLIELLFVSIIAFIP